MYVASVENTHTICVVVVVVVVVSLVHVLMVEKVVGTEVQ